MAQGRVLGGVDGRVLAEAESLVYVVEVHGA